MRDLTAPTENSLHLMLSDFPTTKIQFNKKEKCESPLKKLFSFVTACELPVVFCKNSSLDGL